VNSEFESFFLYWSGPRYFISPCLFSVFPSLIIHLPPLLGERERGRGREEEKEERERERERERKREREREAVIHTQSTSEFSHKEPKVSQ
jgi:hypothetical protein